MLTLDDFDFDLPSELIAQHPTGERSASRLLHLVDGRPCDRRFADLPDMLDAGDLNQPGTFYHELEVRLTTGESLTASDGTFIVEPTNRPTT
jgi:S-adenosylmethionine:tRNA-ribosyltransferase-isomerase (queuine synthetase)